MKKTSSEDVRRVCYPGKKSDNIKLDQEFESLIPPLSPSELADLHKSIDAEKGCRDALIVWKGHNILVAGHNRIRYCREKGYPFPVVEKEFDNRDAVKASSSKSSWVAGTSPHWQRAIFGASNTWMLNGKEPGRTSLLARVTRSMTRRRQPSGWARGSR